MLELLIVLHLLSLGPREATLAAVELEDWPEFGRELVVICKRESPGHACLRRVGLHGNDPPRAIRRFYRKAVARGWLDPIRCPEHRAANSEEMSRFAVRGSHGLAAAYSLRFLADPCSPPEALDVPLLSALAATRRAKAMCSKHGACSTDARRDLWIGKRTAARRLAQKDS